MAINWFRWFGGRSSKEVSSDFFAGDSGAGDPVLTPREELTHAALRDATVIHGADRDWIRAEIVCVNRENQADWDVCLVVSASETDVWERVEAFQATFLQQLHLLGGDMVTCAPAVTWRFISQEAVIVRKRPAGVAVQSATGLTELPQPAAALAGEPVRATLASLGACQPVSVAVRGIGLEGELVV